MEAPPKVSPYEVVYLFQITKSRESYAKSVENLQMELRIVEEENTNLRGDVTK